MKQITFSTFSVLLLALLASGSAPAADSNRPFRPPAVPLAAWNPYLSVWSPANRLTDAATQHWTHHAHPLVSLIRIDGKAYRLMGDEPADVPAFAQSSVQVLPTRSLYEFEEAGVHVSLTFLTPLLPHDLAVFARPVTYVTWTVKSSDGAPHQVALYDSTSALLAVNRPDEPVDWAREPAGALTALRVGTQAQPILGSCGDDHRIDWGYAYAAAPTAQARSAIGAGPALAAKFAARGTLPAQDDPRRPRAANDAPPVLAFAFDLGAVTAEPVSRQVLLAYDELFAVRYFGRKLVPYWRRDGAGAADVLQTAAQEFADLAPRCEAFDRELMADLTQAGGARYAQIAALAYRQALAACGLAADANKQPLLFTKENTSNGDIATVDVFYPMDPMLILLSPTLAKASLVHILMYADSPHWKFPNAPHDLGTYPFVDGRDDGGEGMPVEESGNMLLLCDAIAQAEGHAAFVTPWWPLLTGWAQYLERYGLDPENQLCTDDFMGHLAHNANLSVKAILALAAYGDLCQRRGDSATAAKYAALARTDAAHWQTSAAEGDHTRLAFDKPGTWSQKYNLVWDRVLGLNVFPPSVAQQEIAHYRRVLNRYGVPLDSRTRLTKSDWSVWSATLADNPADFEALVAPLWDYLNETTVRDPLTDSYVTDNAGSGGMHARPVVGGIFIKMLADRAVWEKWAHRDREKAGNWAPLPLPPRVTEVIPTSQRAPVVWRYTTVAPAPAWTQPGFDDAAWSQGPGSFGTRGTPGAAVRTEWKTADLWLRRDITIPDGEHPDLQFYVDHDEDVELYVDGQLAARENGYTTTTYVPIAIQAAARPRFKPGAKLTLAVHCHQTIGGQNIDVGLADVTEPSEDIAWRALLTDSMLTVNCKHDSDADTVA